MRKYAVVRGATPADEAAAIETEFSTSLDSSLTLMSTEDGEPSAIFVGDGAANAVLEYTAEEARTRTLLTDWIDWSLLDATTQQEISVYIAKKDLEVGEQLQGAVLVQGWITLALTGTATPIRDLMEQQLNTSYAASAANNGALSLAQVLIPLIPDAVMSPGDKATFVGLIGLHFMRWPRPVDNTPMLPAQVQEESADFTYSVYVPAYIIDASGGSINVTLPPVQVAGVLPYWWTRVKIIGTGPNTVTFTADPGEMIDGSATLVVSTDRVVDLGASATEWKDLS